MEEEGEGEARMDGEEENGTEGEEEDREVEGDEDSEEAGKCQGGDGTGLSRWVVRKGLGRI